MSFRSFALSALVPLLEKAGRIATSLFFALWGGPIAKYRPEDHYMRGPGPKWREKHAFGRTSARV